MLKSKMGGIIMKKLISVIAALALCASLTACSKAPENDKFAGLKFVDASETMNRLRFDTLESLENGADIAVVGQFINDSVQTVDYDSGLFTDITSSNTLKVTKVLFGDVEVGDELNIKQSYGILDGELISFSKLTPMQKDDEWIFFLKLASDNSYWCAGDSDGRYPTKNSSENGIMSLSEAPELGVYNESEFKRAIYDEIVEKYGI